MIPSCTIIIPTIGRPEFLNQTLESAAAQTYERLDFLVSDNAAEPPLQKAEVERHFAPGRVRLIRHGKRLGFAAHFNLCLKEATGDYAMFLSDDDLLAPDYAAAAMRCFEADPDVSVVLSRQQRIDQNFRGEIRPEPITCRTQTGEQFLRQWYCENDPQGLITTVSLMARRLRMLESGGFGEYPSGAHSDIVLAIRLCSGSKVGLLDSGFFYRVYSTSVGLGMPWQDLWDGTEQYEADLVDLHREGRLSRQVWLALLRAHSSMLLQRWRTLYLRRSGWRNRLLPSFHIVWRVARNFFRWGNGATPGLWRLAKSRSK